jgi:hypothetical protein
VVSRGFIHDFQVIHSTDEPAVVDEEGNWIVATVTENVRGRLGLDSELGANVTNPNVYDLQVLIPTTSPSRVGDVVVVPAGYEQYALAGQYLITERHAARYHTRFLCTRVN